MIVLCGTGRERKGPLVGRGGRRRIGEAGSGRRRQAAGRGASRAGGRYERHERDRREGVTQCEGALRARRGEAYERRRNLGPDAAMGSGAHSTADTARGLQGGVGGLGVRGVVRAARSASSGFRRFRFSAQGRRSVRGKDGPVSELLLLHRH